MDYLQHLGLNKMDGAVKDLIPGAVIKQETRFLKPAKYNDKLTLHVRIADIGRTSYTFHFLTTHKRNRELIAKGSMTLVWLNDQFRPIPIPSNFRSAVQEFEGEHLSDRLKN